MDSGRIFLTAEWRDLVMLNYEVDPSLLRSYVPAGTELDFWSGKAFVSMVGFRFCRTKLFGVLPIPFHSSFEEVNLRFYVKRRAGDEERRGVVFIREIVPRWAIAFVARNVYNENYVALPMTHATRAEGDSLAVTYQWLCKKTWSSLRVEVANCEAKEFYPGDGSLEQFITEHYWGYAVQPDGSCVEYRVEHPQWPVKWARKFTFDGNVEGLYGAELSAALKGNPSSAFLAKGSPVVVMRGRKILSMPKRVQDRGQALGKSGVVPRVILGVVLYDGGCGFCSRWTFFSKSTLLRHGFTIARLQEPWVAGQLQRNIDELLTDIRLLTRDGQLISGADVYLYVARKIWWAWPFYAIFSLPGFNRLMHAGYRWFARNRHRVSATCGLEPGNGGTRKS